MPLVDIHVIEGVFSAADKQQMISKVTDTIGRHRRRKHSVASPGFASMTCPVGSGVSGAMPLPPPMSKRCKRAAE